MVDSRQINKNTELDKILRLSFAQKKALDKLKLKTAENLLRYFPLRYGEPSSVKAVEFLEQGESVAIFGKISELQTKKGFKSKMAFSEARVLDPTGEVKAVWFNQPYIAKMFKEGSLVRIEGKVSKKKDGSLYFSNPKIENVDSLKEASGFSLFASNGNEDNASLSPIYSETRGISSNWLYHSVQKILKLG